MPKSRKSKAPARRSETKLSPVIQFGVVFIWVAVIVLVAWVVKNYT